MRAERTAERRHRLVALALIFLGVGLSTAMSAPFLALFLTDAVGAGSVRVAVFLAAVPVSGIVVATLVGRVSDRLSSRRLLLTAAALASATGAATTAYVRSYWVLLAVAVTVTAAGTALMPQVFAYAREALSGSDRVAVTMSSLRSLFSIAWVAGPPIAAVLVEAGGFTLAYATSAALYTGVALVTVFALPDRPRDADAASPVPPAGSTSAMLWLVVVAFVLTRCAGNLAVQALPLLTIRELDAGVGQAGLLLGLCAALEIPLMVGFGLLSTRVPVHRLLILGAGCGLAYALMVSLAGNVWVLVAGQVLNAAFIAALTGLGVTYVQDLLPSQPGRASTLYSNTFPAGAVLAGPLLGAAQHFGYRMPYVAGAVLCGIAVVLLTVTVRRASRDRAKAGGN
jgi:MFS transporter, SET family, sugar efflux transporter